MKKQGNVAIQGRELGRQTTTPPTVSDQKSPCKSQSDGGGFRRHLRRLSVAAASMVLVGMLTPESASAQATYFGGANADPAAICNLTYHTLTLTMAMTKDQRYASQSYQFQFRIINPYTGAVVGSTGVGYRTTAGQDYFELPAISMPAGGRWRVDYAIRFGTLSGYSAWSAWTPTSYLQTWSNIRYGSWTSTCTT